MEEAHRVLKYWKGNPGQGILLHSDSGLQVYVYFDSNWGACPLTRRSLTGYLVTLGRSSIAWRTKK